MSRAPPTGSLICFRGVLERRQDDMGNSRGLTVRGKTDDVRWRSAQFFDRPFQLGIALIAFGG